MESSNLLKCARLPPPNPTVCSFTGRVCSSGYSYLVTGDSLGVLRYWDFASASKCYTISGLRNTTSRPFYECIEYGNRKMIVCREPMNLTAQEALSSSSSSSVLSKVQKGPVRPENRHQDAILDIKRLEYPVKCLLTCSRDGMVKLWK
jgi:WD40 repeat protein